MRFINYLKNNLSLVAIAGMLFGLSSCGSYQYVGQDENTSSQRYNEGVEYTENVQVASNSKYYQNYFDLRQPICEAGS